MAGAEFTMERPLTGEKATIFEYTVDGSETEPTLMALKWLVDKLSDPVNPYEDIASWSHGYSSELDAHVFTAVLTYLDF